MASQSDKRSVWGRDLSSLPRITNDVVERIASENVHTPTNATKRGYAFFWDEYVHNVEVRQCAALHNVKAKCYRSQEKNAKSHNTTLTVATEIRGPAEFVIVSQHKCSCRAGNGFCQHEIGLLYQLANFQCLGLETVPLIKDKKKDENDIKAVSCTSKSQKWHVPTRTDGFHPRSLSNVRIITPRAGPGGEKRVETGVTNKLYNPITVPLSSLNIREQLLPTFRSKVKQPQWMHLWSRCEDVTMTESKFGSVPKGSLLACQHKPVPEVIDPGEAEPLDLPNLPPLPIVPAHLSEDDKVVLHSLHVTKEESAVYERNSRPQAKCPEWHKLRRNRLTASKFKAITGRKGKFQVLAKDLLVKETKKTAAMQRGNDIEDSVAQAYASRYGHTVYKVGFIINPSAPHLGCSPDRRVFDRQGDPQWGLLEIKTTIKDSVTELQYLKPTVDGLELRRSHAHYEQCLGQMGLSGAKWCDFYVASEDDFFYERILFDEAAFQQMREKLDRFFVNFFLPAIVESN